MVIGIVGEVGEMGGQRFACPRAFERVHPKDPSESRLWRDLLRHQSKTLALDEIVVVDAGVKISDLQEAEIRALCAASGDQLYCATQLPPRAYGERAQTGVRATHSAIGTLLQRQNPRQIVPRPVETWSEAGGPMRAEIWEDVVLPDVTPSPQAKTYNVYAIYDPAYTTPWLLATTLKLKAATVKAIYHDRWPVEQIPLAAKQMVGAHRQFVHADESIQRLPELALLAGSILSFLAATAPVAPSGFWDRQPKRTPGRFRRMLMGKPFPQSYPFSGATSQKSFGYGPFTQRYPGPPTEIRGFSLCRSLLRQFLGSVFKVLYPPDYFSD